jgi:hypothetical protein
MIIEEETQAKGIENVANKLIVEDFQNLQKEIIT